MAVRWQIFPIGSEISKEDFIKDEKKLLNF